MLESENRKQKSAQTFREEEISRNELYNHAEAYKRLPEEMKEKDSKKIDRNRRVNIDIATLRENKMKKAWKENDERMRYMEFQRNKYNYVSEKPDPAGCMGFLVIGLSFFSIFMIIFIYIQ